MTLTPRLFAALLALTTMLFLCSASFAFAQDKVITVHAPKLDQDKFDGTRHPAPLVPPAAEPESAGKSVGVEVHLASTGGVEKAVISRSSGSALLDEAARCWAQYEWIYSPSPRRSA